MGVRAAEQRGVQPCTRHAPTLRGMAGSQFTLAALATTAAFGATGCLIVLLLGSYMVIDNARRNKAQGVNLSARDVSTEKLRDGPKSPDFRWFL